MNTPSKIVFYTTGGTIDKIYFDKKSTYEIGESLLTKILSESNVMFKYEIKSIMKKDSLDITDRDRKLIYNTLKADSAKQIVLTHGTDTIVKTAQKLKGIKDKVIVLTGSIIPARFRDSDAVFNVASAIIAAQLLQPGVYIAINGRVFTPDNIRKDTEKGVFRTLEE
ncbi:asparaginase [bacterium]|nr:asparaginase [bacterium]